MLRQLALMLLALAPVAFVTPVAAQTSPQQYVVVYVEFLPAVAQQGGQKLNQLAVLANQSAGLISFGVNQQIGRANFYSLVEIWRTSKAYQDFLGEASTLLTAMVPLQEAPLDVRLGSLVE